jgi:hypothetical protein
MEEEIKNNEMRGRNDSESLQSLNPFGTGSGLMEVFNSLFVVLM